MMWSNHNYMKKFSQFKLVVWAGSAALRSREKALSGQHQILPNVTIVSQQLAT